jgi:hypothetical protein
MTVEKSDFIDLFLFHRSDIDNTLISRSIDYKHEKEETNTQLPVRSD